MKGTGDSTKRQQRANFRKNKLKGKTLKEMGIFWPYLIIPTHRLTFKPLVFFLRTVIMDFFFIQFRVKWGWKKIPIVQVSSSIDDFVPYRPEVSDTYLDFINFWIRPLNFIILRLGRKRVLPYLAGFVALIGTAYAEASRVYRFRMSTTIRPPAGNNKNMKTIHRVDPHLHCVPSLHIAVIVLTYCFFTDVFRQANLSQEEQAMYAEELWQGAVEIGETVLYVKQHSVNCIPAALYMMTHLLKEQFTIQRATEFIDCLFTTASDIAPQHRQEIQDHIHYMFDRLVLEGCNEEDWTIPVMRWLATQPEVVR